VERQVYNARKWTLLLGQSDVGIKCGICNLYCCIKCLEKIIDIYPKDMTSKNHWYMYVKAFIAETKSKASSATRYPAGPFVGHCCELRFFNKRRDRVQQEQTRFDGCLFLPEYKLIINPCFSIQRIIDIHGFGGFPPYFQGVIHCVPSHKSCVEYQKMGVTATGCASRFRLLDDLPQTIQFQVPYESGKRQVRICIAVQ
jgi:hypothetical protein